MPCYISRRSSEVRRNDDFWTEKTYLLTVHSHFSVDRVLEIPFALAGKGFVDERGNQIQRSVRIPRRLALRERSDNPSRALDCERPNAWRPLETALTSCPFQRVCQRRQMFLRWRQDRRRHW